MTLQVLGLLSLRSGTGFFFLAPLILGNDNTQSKLFLLSNKHVLGDGRERMTLTLNRRADDGTPILGSIRTINIDTFSDHLTLHPDSRIDLACVDVSGLTRRDLYIQHLNHELLTPIDYNRVALGSDVLFVGFPNDYYDTVNNLPLLRKGTLASMPNVDFRGQGHVVIDAQVFGGSSGSPVFVSWDGRYRLFGVIESTAEGLTPSGFPAVLGLGVVIKQRHVKELIDHAVNRVQRAWVLAKGRMSSLQ